MMERRNVDVRSRRRNAGEARQPGRYEALRAAGGRASLVPDGPVARRVGTILAALTMGVMIVFVVVFWVDRIAGADDWIRLFDIGGEANVPTWWNVLLLAMVAMVALLAAEVTGDVDRAARRAWWVVAAAAAYLSLDEATGLHERLGGLVRGTALELPTFAWLLPGVVVASAGAAVLVLAGRRLPPRPARRLAVTLASYAAGAIAIESVNGWIRGRSGDSIPYMIGTLFEESVEMGSCVYAVATILDALQWRRAGADVVISPP